MDLSDQDRLLVNDLINIAWQSGAVKSPQMAQAVEMLRMKLQSKPRGEEVKPDGGK